MQDLLAVRVLLESGVRMLYFPGSPIGKILELSFNDMNAWFKGLGAISDAIYQRYINNPGLEKNGVSRYDNAGTTRIMWDSGNFIPFIQPSLLAVQHVSPPALVQARTVDGTCDGYASIGNCETCCKAYFPGTDQAYACETLDPHNPKRCLDAFFVDNPQAEARPLVEATSVSGLFKQDQGAAVDLLRKLQAAGL